MGVLVCTLLVGTTAWGQASPELFREVSVAPLSSERAEASSGGPSIVRQRYVEIDVEQILPQTEPASPAPPRSRTDSRRRLTFNLFADASYEFQQSRADYSPNGSFVWSGKTTGSQEGEAILIVYEGQVAGSVQTPSGDFFQIRGLSSGVHVVRQVVYQGSPPVDDAVPVPESEIPQSAKAEQEVPVAQQSGPTTIDVMVVYTAAARQAAGGTSAIQSEIQLAIAEMNQSYSNSGVQMQVSLAHSAEVQYNEQVDISTSLNRLRATSDGFMDNVHSLRDQYGADLVALLIDGQGSNGGVVGIGYLMQSVGTYFAGYAFSVTEVNFATGPYYALSHEIGHNLGCAHDRDNAGSPGAYSYSYGHKRSTTPRFRTIMSYNCSGANCPTINNWSNPNVSYQGIPTGVSSSQSNSADNAQTLNNTKGTAAAFRQGGGGGNVNVAPTAVSVSPSSGSGSSQTFSYTFSDGNGYADIPAVQTLINSTLSAQGGCYLYYSRGANRLYLMNDGGTAWLSPVTLGSSGSLSNSQCTVNGSMSSATTSGNNLSVSVALTFKSGFEGGKTNYMLAQDTTGQSSGWQTRGTWTVSGVAPANEPPPQQAAAPEAISVSPSSGSGSSETFTYVFSDPNGHTDLVSVQILLNNALRASDGCYAYVARAANKLFLLNDGGSAWLGPVTPGTSGTVANSQCSINAASSSISGSGNSLSVRLATTFSSGFAGSKYNYMWAYDASGRSSDWQVKGSWTVSSGGGGNVNQAPAIGGVNPSSGSGSYQSFTFSFADPNGYTNIPAAQMLIAPSLTATGTCYLYYARAANRVYLMNDAGNGWLGPISLGSSASVENSQCRIDGAPSSASGTGNNLSVSIAIAFKGGFNGSMRTFAFAQDSGGLATGWQQVGGWTIP